MSPLRCYKWRSLTRAPRFALDTLNNDRRGFTMVELIVTFAIIGILAFLALPAYDKIKTKAQNVRAMEEIRGIERAISAYTIDNSGNFPTTLADVKLDTLLDPWGRNYVYHRAGKPFLPDAEYGAPRFFVADTDPLNDDYDLFSRGPDGHTDPDVSNLFSSDDILRTSEGSWVGVVGNPPLL